MKDNLAQYIASAFFSGTAELCARTFFLHYFTKHKSVERKG
jgi:hypothetical protein